MTYSNLRTALAALALAVASPAFLACSDAPPGEDVEPTGSLNAALLTVGTDGATYQFPAGTLVILSQGNYRNEVALDGMESVLNVQLPVGTLNVQLQFPSTTPQLIRTLGATNHVVDAVWLDTQPVLVAIAQDATTNLTLNFRVTGLGDVTFNMGNLAIALDVQRNTTAQPAQFWEQGTYVNSFVQFGATASPEAQALFAMTPGESHAHFFDFNVTSAWEQRSAIQICAFANFDAFTAMVESGFSRAVNTVIQQNTQICIMDRGMNDEFFANTELLGPALPPYQSALPNGNYRFFLSVGGFLGDVYDGQTFRQSNLEIFTAFSGGQVTHQIFDLALNQQTLLSQGSLSGDVRFVP